MHEKSWHENFMHDIFKHDISKHDNESFAPGRIFSPQTFSLEIGMHTISCMEFSSMKIVRQNLHYMHGYIIFVHEIFMHGNFRTGEYRVSAGGKLSLSLSFNIKNSYAIIIRVIWYFRRICATIVAVIISWKGKSKPTI